MLLIPFTAFWLLLVAGLYLHELSLRSAAAFVMCWLVGVTLLAGFKAPPMAGVALYALLDVILILKIFGADLRLR